MRQSILGRTHTPNTVSSLQLLPSSDWRPPKGVRRRSNTLLPTHSGGSLSEERSSCNLDPLC